MIHTAVGVCVSQIVNKEGGDWIVRKRVSVNTACVIQSLVTAPATLVREPDAFDLSVSCVYCSMLICLSAD